MVAMLLRRQLYDVQEMRVARRDLGNEEEKAIKGLLRK